MNGEFTSIGSLSCGDYIKDKRAGGCPFVAYRAWVGGYATACNMRTPDTANILGSTDVESVMLWLENYCRANPLNGIADGMGVLTIELYPRRAGMREDAGR